MLYRLLGRTGLRVSELALGTMTFGKLKSWGVDATASRGIFAAYAEAGGNFVDTANVYTFGEAERLVGDLVRSDRDRFVVATKYALTTNPNDPNAAGNHRKTLTAAIDASLQRLHLDYVDVLWVHAWDPLTPIEETMAALDQVVRAGKVLYLGVSDMPAWLVAQANTLARERGWNAFCAYQGQYNLMQRAVEREILPMARALGLTFTAWGPLAAGLLTGRDARPHRVREQAGAVMGAGSTEQQEAIVSALRAIADGHGATVSQAALAWMLQRPDTVIPVLGASRPEQMQENLGVLDLTLAPEEIHRLDEVSAIELGFPHDFLAFSKNRMFGAAAELVDGKDV